MPLKRGFTLVELLVVMSIILILVSLAIPATNVARNRAKDTEVKAGLNTIQTALEQHAVDHGGMYPGAQYISDSNGNWRAGPGVIGGTPTYAPAQGGSRPEPHDDYYVPKPGDRQPRGPWSGEAGYMADGTPNPLLIDALVTGGYVDDYPANPFLRIGGGNRSQMSNLFWFRPVLGDTTPDPARNDTLMWNRYTQAELDPDHEMYSTHRSDYTDFARGHFSYIPLNPANNTGIDFAADWQSLTPAEASDYYKRCRGYMLIGWGHTRQDDANAKGVSEKYYNSTLGGFDFDRSMSIDFLESVLGITADGTMIELEMHDSNGDTGSYGTTNPAGGPNIDTVFAGAVFFKITGS